MEEWIEAGKIAKEAREFGKSLIKEDAKIIEVAEQIENKIKELGGKPAFPVGLSVNSMAAHDSPLLNDSRVFRKRDIVKLDMGAHVNGKIADTACTIEIGTKDNTKLIEASEEALNNAIKAVQPGIYVSELGRVIQETITAYGFSPVRNLSGHLIKEYIASEVNSKRTN